jgi:hypothetical protein
MSFEKEEYDVNSFVEVTLPDSENFLKVRETLTRIGVKSDTKKTITQTCHILHKRGRFFILHFKELFLLDGKESNFSEDDHARRNTIANLLAEWGMVTLVDKSKSQAPVVPVSKITILPYKEKNNYQLIAKYTIGKKKKEDVEA